MLGKTFAEKQIEQKGRDYDGLKRRLEKSQQWIDGRIETLAREYDAQADLHTQRGDLVEASVWVNRAIGARAVAQIFASNT